MARFRQLYRSPQRSEIHQLGGRPAKGDGHGACGRIFNRLWVGPFTERRVSGQDDCHYPVDRSGGDCPFGGAMAKKALDYKRKVHVYETDMFQVVNHIHYIKWFEEVRVQLFQEAGSVFLKLLKQGYDIPLVENQCTYKSPLRFGQVAMIKCRVEKLGKSSIHLLYDVFSEDGTLHATGRTVNVLIDASGTPTPFPKEIREYMEGESLTTTPEG